MLIAEATGLRASVAALGEQSGEEESVIADVLAHLTLAVETRSRSKDWVSGEQHLAHRGQRTSAGITHLEELILFAEIRQHARDVVHHLFIMQAIFCKMTVHQLKEEL